MEFDINMPFLLTPSLCMNIRRNISPALKKSHDSLLLLLLLQSMLKYRKHGYFILNITVMKGYP